MNNSESEQLAKTVNDILKGALIVLGTIGILYALMVIFIVIVLFVIPAVFPCTINGTCGTHYFFGFRIYPIL